MMSREQKPLMGRLTLALLLAFCTLSNKQWFMATKTNVGVSISAVMAMEPYPLGYDIEQPDGSIIKAHFSGSEDDPTEEDEDGYTIIGGGSSGNEYQFAVLNDDGDLAPSGVSASDKKNIPKGAGKKLQRFGKAKLAMGLGGSGPTGRKRGGKGRGEGKRGVRKGQVGDRVKVAVKDQKESDSSARARRLGEEENDNVVVEEDEAYEVLTPDEKRERRRRKLHNVTFQDHIDKYEIWDEDIEDFHRRNLAVTWTGFKRNLVVPMMFKGHESRWKPTRDQLHILFNSDTVNWNWAPTGSVKGVFRDASYGKLNLHSTIVNWVPLSKPESYYADGSRGFTTKMHEAMMEALNYLERVAQLDFSVFDTDKDGLIDSICFLHSGYAAEWGGNSEDGANYLDRIWSHKWSLYSIRVPSDSPKNGWTSARHNVRVYNYHISPAIYGTFPSNKIDRERMGRIGVIAHETGHFLGIDDLYDKVGNDGNGIGSWGLMANSWGFMNNQWCIPNLDPWSKIQLGWLRPSEITTTGNYGIASAYSTQEVKIIKKGFPTNEYLLLEYRRQQGVEYCMPKEGMLIWHIDDNADYDYQGYPGQVGWPENGKHYRISLVQADGIYGLETKRDRGDIGDLFYSSGVNGITPSGLSNGKRYPNTDSYQGGNIRDTGVKITNIRGEGNNRMWFRVEIPANAGESRSSEEDGPVNCNDSQKKLVIKVKTDASGSQNSWRTLNVTGGNKVVATGGPYPDGKWGVSHDKEVCLDKTKCYKFNIYDTASNGINGAANGWQVTWGDKVIAPIQRYNNPFSVDGVDFGRCTKAGGGGSITRLQLFGNGAYYGNMFDMKAREDILVRRIQHIHTADVGTYRLRIYTKNGSYRGYETDADVWNLVQDQTITGSGYNRWTSTNLLNFSNDVPVMAGTTQAFYVVLDKPKLVFIHDADTLNEGELYARHDKFDLMVGTYNTQNFSWAGRPAVFNGIFLTVPAYKETSGSDTTTDEDEEEGADVSAVSTGTTDEIQFNEEGEALENTAELTNEMQEAIARAMDKVMTQNVVLPLPSVLPENGEDDVSTTDAVQAQPDVLSMTDEGDEEELADDDDEYYVGEEDEDDYYYIWDSGDSGNTTSSFEEEQSKALEEELMMGDRRGRRRRLMRGGALLQ